MVSGRTTAGVLGVAIVVAATACSTTPPPPTSAPSAAAAAGGVPQLGCAADVAPAPLPGWARSGFSPPDQPVPFVLGERGTILGVLFGQPLSAPAAPDRGNKILWVTRDPHPPGPLTITAALDGAVATLEVPEGPGPSLVDLPTPGCWRLTLAWPDHTDRVAIAYR
jgi:hypothetical protein